MYLNRCFQTGETPIAGPLLSDELSNDDAFNYGDGEPPSSSTLAGHQINCGDNFRQSNQAQDFHSNPNQISSGLNDLSINSQQRTATSPNPNISNFNTLNQETKTPVSTGRL